MGCSDGKMLKMCSQKGNKPTQFLKITWKEHLKHIYVFLTPLRLLLNGNENKWRKFLMLSLTVV